MVGYDLDDAYSIDGPEDAKAMYRSWAETYDRSFAERTGYSAPAQIAAIFRAETCGDEPVLDIGAGTGLLAEGLAGITVDGFDLSPEMLKVAHGKGLYRKRIVGNVLEPLELDSDSYGGAVSCGTFTHGHVDASCLPELLRVVRSGGLFVCGTNAEVFDSGRFGSTLARAVSADRITPVRFREIALYDKRDHDHGEDRGLVMIFRKR